MAHEIAHVAARHGVEQASKGQLVNWGTLPLIFLGGWGGFGARQAASLLIPMGFLKFSRNAEFEADVLGAQYMWATGYDPHALASFFEKLQTKDKARHAGQNFQHPSDDRRPHFKRQQFDCAFPDRSEYTLNTSEFNQVKARLIGISTTRIAGKNGGI